MRITAAAALCLILGACSLGGGSTASPSVGAASSERSPDVISASGPRISPPPVTPPTPPGTNLPAFACSDTGGGKTGHANFTAARVAEQVDYDRFVLQFDGPVPTYTVKRQPKPTFPLGATGQTITLSGTAGALVRINASTQSSIYTGPTDLTHPEFLLVKEARLTEDFEGYVSWAIGLDHAVCMRTFTLTGPNRLVVDFTTATS